MCYEEFWAYWEQKVRRNGVIWRMDSDVLMRNMKRGRILRLGTGLSPSNCLLWSEFLVLTDFGVCLPVELWQDARNGQRDQVLGAGDNEREWTW